MKQTFQDGLGQTILSLEYFEKENYLHVAYIGLQTLPVLREASELILRIFKEKECSKYLSDNSRLVGGKEFANLYIRDVFIPKAMENGLKCLAYVVPPQAVNIQSVARLEITFPPELEFMLFDNVADARYWLLCK